jgi:hypothetical protein
MTTTYEAIAGNSHEATKGLTNRFAGEKETTGALIEASGTLKSPAAGKQLILYWIWLYSSQENAGEVSAVVTLGAKEVYVTYLGNPGAFAHWEPVEGEVNDKLGITLSGTQKIAVSFTYSERTP